MNPSTRGLTAVRMIKALGIARGDASSAIAYAKSQGWGNEHEVVSSIKGAVTAEGVSDVALPTPAAFDFAEFVRPLTILGKLIGLRRVPARTRLISATSGSTSYWSGERKPRPISRMTLTGATLEQLSVVAMLVTTSELLRSSAPSAEAILSRDLAAAAVQALDEAFIGFENAGIPGVMPASVSYGVTPVHAAGSSLGNIDSDLALTIQALSDAGSDLTFATWVMKPRTALFLARLRGSGGALAYPGMTAKGGTLLGLPCVTSTAVPLQVGSPTTAVSAITLLDPSQILVTDDGGSGLEVAEQTTLQMESSPGVGAQSVVSMWQTDSVALRLTRYANWTPCRAGMAQVLDEVLY